VPGAESGRADEVDDGDSTARVIARGALFVPKLVLEVAISPVRGAVWADDKYHLEDLYYRTFYNHDRTFGIVPTASYATGLGPSVGAHMIATDLGGDHEAASVQGTIGGTYRSTLDVAIDSGERLDWLKLGAGGDFDRLPTETFYGIGNGGDSGRPGMPVDPRTDLTAYPAHYRLQDLRATAFVDSRVTRAFHVIGRGGVSELEFSPSTADASSIDMIYDTSTLVGFQPGLQHLYGELELRLDTRGPGRLLEPVSTRGGGSLASVFAGRVHSLDGGADFTHYGVDLQHIVHLGIGPRVFLLRYYGEGVTGSRDEVPFIELPSLGGDFLRGYPYQRFRDRVAMFGSAQYQWDLSHYFDAYLFVDGGRVFDSLDSLALEHMRVGYGTGIEMHTQSDFLITGTIATSIDGGIQVLAAFNRIIDRRQPWR
jgi:hypothetical protein